jgi:hypothetical protein
MSEYVGSVKGPELNIYKSVPAIQGTSVSLFDFDSNHLLLTREGQE